MKRYWLIINSLIPLMLGALVYMISSKQVIFVGWLSKFVDIVEYHFDGDSLVWRFIRYYLLDMLWAYSLCSILFFIFDNKAAMWKVLAISIVFSTAMEAFQILAFIPGTFDVLDVVVEIIAEIIAAFIIKITFQEEIEI